MSRRGMFCQYAPISGAAFVMSSMHSTSTASAAAATQANTAAHTMNVRASSIPNAGPVSPIRQSYGVSSHAIASSVYRFRYAQSRPKHTAPQNSTERIASTYGASQSPITTATPPTMMLMSMDVTTCAFITPRQEECV